MIQRIQTIYLAISLILFSFLLFLPFIKYDTSEGIFEFFALGLKNTSQNPTQMIISAIPVLVLIIIIIAIQIFTIIKFKNRMLQIRLSFLSIFLMIGVYILVIAYNYFGFEITAISTSFQFSMIIPVLSIILTYMANRKIKKDEDLVRSVDRIR